MGYTHTHRLLKKYNLPYNLKLTLDYIADITKLPLDFLQEIYDKEYAEVKKSHLAINKVCSVINRILEGENKILEDNKNER